MVEGTATLVEFREIPTMAPPAGATVVSSTVQTVDVPALTVLGLHVRLLTAGLDCAITAEVQLTISTLSRLKRAL
jgi:hypothetical protein